MISSKSRVYSLKDCDPFGLSVSRSVGFPKMTVLIGRTGFDTMYSIPDPTLSFSRLCFSNHASHPTDNRAFRCFY